MGKLIATVTRTATGLLPYNAHVQSGYLGSYHTAGEAQRAVEASFGGRALRWRRQDMPGEIEHYAGADPSWWPLDMPGRLRGWWDSDQGVQPVDDAGVERVVEWNSFDGSGSIEATQTVPANAPQRIQGIGPAGLDVVRFAVASAETLVTNLTLADPLTLSLVAAYQPSVNPSANLVNAGPIIRENAGLWELQTDLGSVAGPPPVPGAPVVVTAALDGVNATFWVNGALMGQALYTPGSWPVLFSDPVAWWVGDLMSAVFADTALPATVRTSLVNYQRRRYAIP